MAYPPLAGSMSVRRCQHIASHAFVLRTCGMCRGSWAWARIQAGQVSMMVDEELGIVAASREPGGLCLGGDVQ
jgi:hypothetical protein